MILHTKHNFVINLIYFKKLKKFIKSIMMMVNYHLKRKMHYLQVFYQIVRGN